MKINNDDIFLFPNNTILTHSIYFEQLDSSKMDSVDLFPCPLIAFRQYKNPIRTISQISRSFSIKFHKTRQDKREEKRREKRQGRSDKDFTQTLSLTANNLKKTTYAFL